MSSPQLPCWGVFDVMSLLIIQPLCLLLFDASPVAIIIRYLRECREMKKRSLSIPSFVILTFPFSTFGSPLRRGARITGTRAARMACEGKNLSTRSLLLSELSPLSPDRPTDRFRSRDTPFPTLQQLDEVFSMLPDEPTGVVARTGPQYNKPRVQTRTNADQRSTGLRSTFSRLLVKLGLKTEPAKRASNPMGFLRNGDRALVVAVNDCGNTGWIRFGRSGFESIVMA